MCGRWRGQGETGDESHEGCENILCRTFVTFVTLVTFVTYLNVYSSAIPMKIAMPK
jgi:hypothetical protein